MRGRFLSADEVADRIRDHIEVKKPFSYIRLGDGEGALLSYQPASATEEDVAYFKTHLGDAATPENLLLLQEKLEGALAGADLIGIRDEVWTAVPTVNDDDESLAEFRQRLALREAELKIVQGHALKRVHGLYSWLRRQPMADGREWCSQWIHWDLQLAGFWQRLLPRCGSLTVINASPTVRATMEKHLGVAIDQIRVPEKHIVRSRWPDDSGEAAFPDAYERVAKQLDRPLSGKVFVVAAGLVGKSFCHLIKANGGVALDLGALLDAWDGRSTRPVIYASKIAVDPSHKHFMLAPHGPGQLP